MTHPDRSQLMLSEPVIRTECSSAVANVTIESGASSVHSPSSAFRTANPMVKSTHHRNGEPGKRGEDIIILLF